MTLTLLRGAVVVLFALLGAATASTTDLGVAAGAGLGAFAALVAVALEAAAGRVPLPRLVWGTAGALVGLVGGHALNTLLAPFSGGPGPLLYLYAAIPLLGAWIGGAVGVRRADELPGGRSRAPRAAERLLDTSVIIDGRIAEVAEAGFLDGTLVVPQFVVRELQRLADSGDAVRRNRGRRGFDVLERLRKSAAAQLTIVDVDVAGAAEVDAKLVALARERGARLLTNDAALGRTASLAGVVVGNLHELALALKPAALPGETMQVQVLREGKEAGQGVAYLDDGTMVVVEGGKRFVGQTLDVVVTSALQTAAGRMIFARPRGEEPARDA
ncbi:MAG: PIN domain nuclease [Candidatus Rokuibacteriota bacterium]|nr:MAG: PIN domain nuclease [Candidatus Rokubacteria bacterium]